MSRCTRVYLIVEGQTEQTFVRELLAPMMAEQGVFLEARLLGRGSHKGGNVSFERMLIDVGILLRQESNTYISTMVDYFRIDPEWPGKKQIDQRVQSGESLSVQEKADALEHATLQAIMDKFSLYDAETRFVPYIEMHEFEALLFTDPLTLAMTLDVKQHQVESIVQHYQGNPEAINNNPEHAPSQQIMSLNRSYRKVAMGVEIARKTGISSMRRCCQHFHQWLEKIEEL